MDSNNGKYYILRGMCYYFKNKYGNAVADLEKAQKLGEKLKPATLEVLSDALSKASGQ